MTMANAIFDAHCDTVLKVIDEGENVLAENPRTHLDGASPCAHSVGYGQ